LDKLVVVRRNARKPQITFWLKASAILTAHRNVAIEGYRRQPGSQEAARLSKNHLQISSLYVAFAA
jgi:hypothetical protein